MKSALAGAAVGAGAALAVLLAARTLRDDPAGPREAAADGRIESLLSELTVLGKAHVEAVDRLERIEALLAERLPVAADGAAPPAAAPDPRDREALAEMVDSLDALRRALELNTLVAEAVAQRAGRPSDGGLFDASAIRHDVDWGALELLESSWRQDARATDRAQYFRSPADVLASYGPPSAIYRPARGGLLFSYRRAPDEVLGPTWYFRVQDGMVVEFFVEDEIPAQDD
jgi:hypothetical protein